MENENTKKKTYKNRISEQKVKNLKHLASGKMKENSPPPNCLSFNSENIYKNCAFNEKFGNF